ncbi:MAG: VanW family protein [Clostridia bacterium]|nr:VanW family protein [Clostridia bacterium]
MRNSTKILIILAIILGLGIGIYFIRNNIKKDEGSSNYEAEKTSTQTNEINNVVNDNTSNSNNSNPAEKDKNPIQNESVVNNTTQENSISKEEELSSFSTKIVTKDSNRQHNINLTCSTLDNTIVEAGSTFSFTNTVGQATSAKGYKKADIFDANGKKKKGLGGGNCQISTTLYNAVLAVPNLAIIERHAHSNYVPYIQKGKDAAVAYRKL